MENLIVAINCVLPVFLTICTGALIRRSGIVPDEAFTYISRISFQFLLPCTLFHSIYTTNLDTAFDAALLAYLVTFLLAWFAVGFGVSTAFIPDHRTRGAFIQTFFRSNIAIVGISMADSMMGSAGVAAISVIIAVFVPLYNVLAVITLELCRGGKVYLRSTLLSILKNPLILGCILGIVFLIMDIKIPASILKAVNQIGNAGSTMPLLALGGSFRFSSARKNLKKIIAANLLRLVISPMVALIFAVLLGFRGNALGIVLLSTAPSLATSSHPMAIARDSDHELTGQIVVTTFFFCCITLFLWIFLLKQLSLL